MLSVGTDFGRTVFSKSNQIELDMLKPTAVNACISSALPKTTFYQESNHRWGESSKTLVNTSRMLDVWIANTQLRKSISLKHLISELV